MSVDGGLEIRPLVCPHRPTEPGFGHNEGFDAVVRIQECPEMQEPGGQLRSRVSGRLEAGVRRNSQLQCRPGHTHPFRSARRR